MQLLQRTVDGAVLNQHFDGFAGLFVAVDGDHLHLCLVPVLTVTGEDVEQMPFAYLRCLAIAEDKRLDLVHHLFLCVGAIDRFHEIGFFYFGGVVLAGLLLINSLYFMKNHNLSGF